MPAAEDEGLTALSVSPHLPGHLGVGEVLGENQIENHPVQSALNPSENPVQEITAQNTGRPVVGRRSGQGRVVTPRSRLCGDTLWW
jgi:hypothetical protein